jgi:hypothetical protein
VPSFVFASAAAAIAARIEAGPRRRLAMAGAITAGGLAAVAALAGLVRPANPGTLDLALAGGSAIAALGWLIIVAVLARLRPRVVSDPTARPALGH